MRLFYTECFRSSYENAPLNIQRALCRNDFLADMVQSDDFRVRGFVKVAPHRVAYFVVQLIKRASLGKNGSPEGSCGVAAFRCLFDDEDDLIHMYPNGNPMDWKSPRLTGSQG